MANRISNLQTKNIVRNSKPNAELNDCRNYYNQNESLPDYTEKPKNTYLPISNLLETGEKQRSTNDSSQSARINKGQQKKGVFTPLAHSEHDLVKETKETYRRTKSFETLLPNLTSLQSTQMLQMDQSDQVWMDNWRLPSRSKTSKNNPGFQLYPDDVTGTDQQQRSKVSGEKRNRLIDKRGPKNSDTKLQPAKSMEDLIALHKSTNHQDVIRERVLRATALKAKSQENLAAVNSLSIAPVEPFIVSRSLLKSNEKITPSSPANQTRSLLKSTENMTSTSPANHVKRNPSKSPPQQKFVYTQPGRIAPVLNLQEDLDEGNLNYSESQLPKNTVSKIPITLNENEAARNPKPVQKKRPFYHIPFFNNPEHTQLSLKSVTNSERHDNDHNNRNTEWKNPRIITNAGIASNAAPGAETQTQNSSSENMTPQTRSRKFRPAVKHFPEQPVQTSFQEQLNMRSNLGSTPIFLSQKVDMQKHGKHNAAIQDVRVASRKSQRLEPSTNDTPKTVSRERQVIQTGDDKQNEVIVNEQSGVTKNGNYPKPRAEDILNNNFSSNDESAVFQKHSSRNATRRADIRPISKSTPIKKQQQLMLKLDHRENTGDEMESGDARETGRRSRETPTEHGDPDKASLDERLRSPPGQNLYCEQRDEGLETDLESEVSTQRLLEGEQTDDEDFTPLNSSYMEPCFNDVMTRIASTMSSERTDSSLSLWEDDDFAKEATSRVSELFETIDQLLYHGFRATGIPDRVVQECDDWRVVFPQLRIEAGRSLTRSSGRHELEDEEFGIEDKRDEGDLTLYGDSVTHSEPMSSSMRKKQHPKPNSAKSRSIADFCVEGQECSFHDLPKLLRSFDDFTHKTIPLTYEQLVEEVFHQDGHFEELIAFDQEDSSLDYQEKFHVPRKKTGVPPVTPFTFRVDDIVREIFQSIWKEVLPCLRQYTGTRMSGFTSAALRELLVTPEMNPLMSKFLESQPDTSVLSPPSTSHQIYSRMEIRIPTAQDQRASTAENGIPFWSPLRKSPLQNASISPPDDKGGGGDIFTPSKFQRREVVKKKTKPDLITGVKTFLRNSTYRQGDVHGTTRGQLKTPSRSKRPGTQENEVPADLRAERNDLDFNQFISSYPALPTKDSASNHQQHPTTGKRGPIYTRQTKGVFKTPTPTASDRKLNKPSLNRHQNPLYFV